MRHGRPDYTRIQDPAGIIPADEPVFLIRGQDRAAPEAVRSYADIAQRAGAPRSVVDECYQWAMEIQRWQETHPEKVKVADHPKPDCPECRQGTIVAGVCDTCGHEVHQ